MIEDHEADIEAFRAQADEARTEIDRFAAKTLPTLEAHLQHARSVERQLESAPPMRRESDPMEPGETDRDLDRDFGFDPTDEPIE